ncbi:hypothetical protein SEA_DIZZYRUDY_78 [Microbacterium phage DizzyRudy]|nr:hypothetical protein SEA_DIZZYRUDY_78 [Microbacterium phage DizzyRudy]
MRSEGAQVGAPFAALDPGNEDASLIVFHPLDYNYAAYDDPFEAHTLNMAYIYSMIERRAEEALGRLDAMVDYLNHKYDPRIITFLHNVEVTENADGSFTFSANAGDEYFGEDRPFVEDYMKGYV